MFEDNFKGLRSHLKTISMRNARDESLAILHEEIAEGPKSEEAMRAKPGLIFAAGIAMSLWSMKTRLPKGKGYGKLAKELDEIASSMRAAAGNLNQMSDSARWWIYYRSPKSFFPEEAEVYKADIDSQAYDAFNAPHLPQRLDGLAKVLDFMAEKVRQEGAEKKGARKVFQDPPIDLDLFENCAKVLHVRGRTLDNLRPIVQAVYAYATRNPAPIDDWAARQEKAARTKFGTHMAFKA